MVTGWSRVGGGSVGGGRVGGGGVGGDGVEGSRVGIVAWSSVGVILGRSLVVSHRRVGGSRVGGSSIIVIASKRVGSLGARRITADSIGRTAPWLALNKNKK